MGWVLVWHYTLKQILIHTSSYPFSICALLFHSTSFKFSFLDSVTCEGHLGEEIQKIFRSSVSLTVADCMPGFKGKFYLENT
jgi:hypothetical protein